jgi:hypothetical protein
MQNTNITNKQLGCQFAGIIAFIALVISLLAFAGSCYNARVQGDKDEGKRLELYCKSRPDDTKCQRAQRWASWM